MYLQALRFSIPKTIKVKLQMTTSLYTLKINMVCPTKNLAGRVTSRTGLTVKT